MSYREVTKDDVGKECEYFFLNNWRTGDLLFVLDKPTSYGSRFVCFNPNANTVDCSSEARIRTSPLPDGWLPDDWRVLGDNEACKLGDWIVWKRAINEPFTKPNSLYFYEITGGGFINSEAICVTHAPGCDHHLCVIRPRWRPATKDDVGKHALSIHYVVPFPLVSIFEPDQYGIDCALRHECGYRFDRLKDLKVENEGWNVTN